MHRSGEKVLGQFGFVPSEDNKNTNDGKNISEDFIYFYRGVSEPINKTFLIEPSVFRGEDEWDLKSVNVPLVLPHMRSANIFQPRKKLTNLFKYFNNIVEKRI